MSEPQPNPMRVETIRRWYIDQAVAEANPVALLNLTITTDGQLVTKGLGIEPAHAQIMLPELRAVIDRIESQLVDKIKPELHLVRSGCSAGPAKVRVRRSKAKVAQLRLV